MSDEKWRLRASRHFELSSQFNQTECNGLPAGPPGGLPAGACSGPDTRGNNARFTLICDGLPAGPPGGLPAGACSGLDTRGMRLGSHCVVMASRRALRGRLQRARRTKEFSRVGRRKKRTEICLVKGNRNSLIKKINIALRFAS